MDHLAFVGRCPVDDTVLLRLEHAELDNEVEEIITEAWLTAETSAKQVRAL
jgi:hypothetical protein